MENKESNVIRTLSQAADSKSSVKFSYEKKDGSRRAVRGVVKSMGSRHVILHDADRDAVRRFNIDQFLSDVTVS